MSRGAAATVLLSLSIVPVMWDPLATWGMKPTSQSALCGISQRNVEETITIFPHVSEKDPPDFKLPLVSWISDNIERSTRQISQSTAPHCTQEAMIEELLQQSIPETLNAEEGSWNRAALQGLLTKAVEYAFLSKFKSQYAYHKAHWERITPNKIQIKLSLCPRKSQYWTEYLLQVPMFEGDRYVICEAWRTHGDKYALVRNGKGALNRGRKLRD